MVVTLPVGSLMYVHCVAELSMRAGLDIHVTIHAWSKISLCAAARLIMVLCSPQSIPVAMLHMCMHLYWKVLNSACTSQWKHLRVCEESIRCWLLP